MQIVARFYHLLIQSWESGINYRISDSRDIRSTGKVEHTNSRVSITTHIRPRVYVLLIISVPVMTVEFLLFPVVNFLRQLFYLL